MATILSVEDEPLVAKQIRQALKPEHDVIEAIDGQEAWVLIGESKPDLVIADAAVPRLSGWDLVRRINMDRETRGIPSIIIVSRNSLSARIIAKLMGASAVLKKPIEPTALRNAARAALASVRPRL